MTRIFPGRFFFSSLKTASPSTKQHLNISSVYKRGKYFFLSFSALLLLALNACNDPDEIGLNVLPPGDVLNQVMSDTTTVVTRLEREDSLRSDELSLQLLGSINDPVFGKHQAVINTQVLLAGIPNFNGYTTCDSLILALVYSSYYGDTSVSQTVYVNRLTDDLYIDSTYYTSQTFASDPSPLAAYTFNPAPKTPVVVGTDTAAVPQLRIPLSTSLGDTIMALNGMTELSGNDPWRTYFKGLNIHVDPVATGNGCISYFNFYNSALILYYHDTSNVVKTYSFSLTGARVNSFEHDYTGVDAGRQLADSTYNDSLTYVQAMGSIKSKISFPFLKHFTDSGSIVVNKAQLVLTVQGGTPLDYPPPANLLVLAIQPDGSVALPLDYYESTVYYGGAINTETNTYTFNLVRYIQNILNGTSENDGLYLVVAGSSVSANRVVLGSGTNNSYKAQLKIYYTRVP